MSKTDSFRTQDGYKTLNLGGSGIVTKLDANLLPATLADNVQTATVSNAGGAAVGVVTLPDPAGYVGSATGILVFVEAGANPEDVQLTAASGTTIDGGASITLTANATVQLIAESATAWISARSA